MFGKLLENSIEIAVDERDLDFTQVYYPEVEATLHAPINPEISMIRYWRTILEFRVLATHPYLDLKSHRQTMRRVFNNLIAEAYQSDAGNYTLQRIKNMSYDFEAFPEASLVLRN